MQELILDIVAKVIMLVVMLVVAVFCKKATPFLENSIVQMVVAHGVRFVQQAYGHLDGQQKSREALAVISKRLEKWKIYLEPEEIQIYVESILLELKAKYGEEWKKNTRKV